MEYSEKVVDHYTNPRNVGKIEEAIHEAIADYYRKVGILTEDEIKIKCNLKEYHCESCG